MTFAIFSGKVSNDGLNLDRDSNDAGDIEKYRKYEADYTQRLMAKYFSKKTIYGG